MSKQNVTPKQRARRMVRTAYQLGLDELLLKHERDKQEAIARYRESFRVLTGAR